MAEFEALTCIKFVKRKTERDYLNIKSADGWVELTNYACIVFQFFTTLILCDLREERGMDLLAYLASARTQQSYQELKEDTEVMQIMGKHH